MVFDVGAYKAEQPHKVHGKKPPRAPRFESLRTVFATVLVDLPIHDDFRNSVVPEIK